MDKNRQGIAVVLAALAYRRQEAHLKGVSPILRIPPDEVERVWDKLQKTGRQPCIIFESSKIEGEEDGAIRVLLLEPAEAEKLQAERQAKIQAPPN